MDYLKLIRTRITFPLMQEYCALQGLPTSVGWDKLQGKLEEEARHSKKRSLEIDNALAVIYRKTIPLGERAIRFYKLEAEAVVPVRNYLKGLKPEESPFTEKYPLPLTEAALKRVRSGLHLCEVSSSDTGVSLVFCGKRLVEERVDRTRDEINEEALRRFGWDDYDEFVFIKRRYVQSYEVVRLDTTNKLIDIRVEQHVGIDTGNSLHQLQSKVNDLLATKFNANYQQVSAVNLFPAIKKLYDAASEGVVAELGFTVDTGSAKHEKMRNNLDLRKELFHTGGKKAVGGVITPYRIAVRWNDPNHRVSEEALLPGSIRQLGSGVPHLDHAVLSGALTEARMQVLADRIIKHLPADED